MKRIAQSIAFWLVALGFAHGAHALDTTTKAFPLKISANGRYFVDQNNKPFRINSEAAWLMSINATAAEVDEYLADRKSKGWNSFILMAMVHAGDYTAVAPQAPKNKAGDAPHTIVGDFSSTPVEAYWAFIDTIIDKAATQGMAVIFAYTYLGYAGGNQGWWQEINQAINTQAVCFNWGVWLGNRYKTKKNIIWYTLGDYSPPTGSEGAKRAHKIVEGIKSVAPWALFGGEPSGPDQLSTDVTDFRDVLDMNSFYGYGPNRGGLTYLTADRAFTYTPTKPAWVGEPNYYQENFGGSGDRSSTRQQVLYSVFGGGTAGDSTGSHNIWSWTAFRTDLGIGYSIDRQALFALMDSMPWYELVPSGTGGGHLGKTLVTSNNPDDSTHVAALATPTGAWLTAYTPGTSPFSIDMTAMAGSTRARWYDPTSGAFTLASASIANAGTYAFTTPGKNSGGDKDWIIVLDSAGVAKDGGMGGATGSGGASSVGGSLGVGGVSGDGSVGRGGADTAAGTARADSGTTDSVGAQPDGFVGAHDAAAQAASQRSGCSCRMVGARAAPIGNASVEPSAFLLALGLATSFGRRRVRVAPRRPLSGNIEMGTVEVQPFQDSQT